MKLIKAHCILIFFSLICIQSFAEVKSNLPTVNILSWWGFLDYPAIINGAKKECGVNLSFDEYYSNDEFLRRWKERNNNYDVIIFSDTIYNFVKEDINKNPSSLLYLQSHAYNKIIKNHYIKAGFPPNVVYFVHALTGILWNPAVIQLKKNDSIFMMFKKASNNLVVIIDDPIEAKKFIDLGWSAIKRKPTTSLTIESLRNITQRARIYITNDYSQIYKNPQFAFSFTWSGEAVIDLKKSYRQYQFLVHPKLSYISSDLLAQISKSKNAFCVSKFLTSKKTMSIIQNKDFYFSPYAETSTIIDPRFKELYKQFLLMLPTSSWVDSVALQEFDKINRSWKLIKISLSK